MIEWVNEKMIIWGDWVRRRDDGGLGYSKDSSLCLMGASGGISGSVVLAESDALRVESIMMEVKTVRPELYKVGREWYLTNAPAATVASRIGCHRDTVYSRLDSLHVFVANRITERFPK